jgi:hypothetical protein
VLQLCIRTVSRGEEGGSSGRILMALELNSALDSNNKTVTGETGRSIKIKIKTHQKK